MEYLIIANRQTIMADHIRDKYNVDGTPATFAITTAVFMDCSPQQFDNKVPQSGKVVRFETPL